MTKKNRKECLELRNFLFLFDFNCEKSKIRYRGAGMYYHSESNANY